MLAAARLGVCLTAIGVHILASGMAAPAASASAVPPLVLSLRLVATQELAPLAAQALRSEAESIWRAGNVSLRWVDGDAAPDAGAFLKMLVLARPETRRSRNSGTIAGELVRADGTPAIAIASITAARRAVEEQRRLALPESPVTEERRLGLVLGRVLAHEIGHYLLDTDTHAGEGLMRARIAAHEFADLRPGAFHLDKAATAYLAALTAAGPVHVPVRPFSYTRP
jgi:hypothetical protein